MCVSLLLTRTLSYSVVIDSSGKPLGKVIEACCPNPLAVEYRCFFSVNFGMPPQDMAGIVGSHVLLNPTIEEVAGLHRPRNGTPQWGGVLCMELL